MTPQQQDWIARFEIGLLVAVWFFAIVFLRHPDWLKWILHLVGVRV